MDYLSIYTVAAKVLQNRAGISELPPLLRHVNRETIISPNAFYSAGITLSGAIKAVDICERYECCVAGALLSRLEICAIS